MNALHVTIDRLIPNEVADGADQTYAEEHGFLTADHMEVDMTNVFGERAGEIKAACGMRLRHALRVFGERYGVHGVEDNGTTLYQSDWSVNHRTGVQTRLALHIADTVSDASIERIKRIVIGE